REVFVAPLRRRLAPDDLQIAGGRVIPLAGAESALPAEALLLERSALGFGTEPFLVLGGAVGLAEGVAASDQRDGLFVIHSHALECLPDIDCCRDRLRLDVRPLRLDVD